MTKPFPESPWLFWSAPPGTPVRWLNQQQQQLPRLRPSSISFYCAPKKKIKKNTQQLPPPPTQIKAHLRLPSFFLFAFADLTNNSSLFHHHHFPHPPSPIPSVNLHLHYPPSHLSSLFFYSPYSFLLLVCDRFCSFVQVDTTFLFISSIPRQRHLSFH